jgi:predicted amidohydrolase
VALFQQDSDAGNVLGQLRMLAQEADRIRGRADVLVCPQLYMTGYNVGSRVLTLAEGQRGAFLTAVQRIARAAGLAIVCGYPEAADGHCYNAAVAIDAAGNKLANHRKLVGSVAINDIEYIPISDSSGMPASSAVPSP